ncbi:hypothetical protein [Agromyces sp. SYSU T00194]|uniref:hypothetical protein n=1 Tax=Agromyces chitinivorans TaxID=3158560 RepID=UPI0033909A4C
MNHDELVAKTDWPKRDEDATADAMILHGARLTIAWQAETHQLMTRAFAVDRESAEYKPAMRRYVDAVQAMLAEAQVVVALVQVQRRSPELADEIARELYSMTEDGGVVGELMWEYLDARGVDADAAFSIIEELTTAEHGEPEPDGSGVSGPGG